MDCGIRFVLIQCDWRLYSINLLAFTSFSDLGFQPLQSISLSLTLNFLANASRETRFVDAIVVVQILQCPH